MRACVRTHLLCLGKRREMYMLELARELNQNAKERISIPWARWLHYGP